MPLIVFQRAASLRRLHEDLLLGGLTTENGIIHPKRGIVRVPAIVNYRDTLIPWNKVPRGWLPLLPWQLALTLGGKASATSASGTTLVLGPFDVDPSVGGKILGGIGWFDDTPRTVSIVDDATGGSNSYAACGAKIAGGGSTEAIQLFEAPVVNTKAGLALTITYSGSTSNMRASFVWIAGSPGSSELYHGQLQSTGITTTDGTTTGSLGTPSAAGAFVFAFSRSSSQPDNYAAGTGFTAVHNLNVANRTFSEYLVQGAAAAVAGTFTQDYTNSIQTVGVVVVPAGGAAFIPRANARQFQAVARGSGY